MADTIEINDMVLWGAAALAAYLVYQYWQGQNAAALPVSPSAPPPPPPASASAPLPAGPHGPFCPPGQMLLPQSDLSCNTFGGKQVCPPPAPDQCVPIPSGMEGLESAVPALEARMVGLAGRDAGTVDDWNYILKSINPNSVVTDLSNTIGTDKRFPMTARRYLAHRVRSGLPVGAPGANRGGAGVYGSSGYGARKEYLQ